jgi:periplasmic glucans biosynthesis protein
MLRRDWLKAVAALSASALARSARAQAGEELKHLGEPQPFDYARLKGRARALAAGPYRKPAASIPDAIEKMGYDQYQAIEYRREHGLWANQDGAFEARFFHLGMFFHSPVRMYELVKGQAYELAYDPAMFRYGKKSGLNPAALPADLGFAGFRLIYQTDRERDVAAFLGASYFRAVGGELQYGLSARALAVDTGMGRPEEFPLFTHFWLERPPPGSDRAIVYALLDSPSVAGAYRFEIVPGWTLLMDVDAALYPRAPIERLGVAPLTSMFLHAENDRRVADDWRPEIHDSDGLSLWSGRGEWIWRPLTNPAQLRFNAYQDENPRGFGLLQRDRDFEHYQDDGAYYDRRPSLWVEPRSNWGKGSVQLVELPTKDETFDNIVAFWNPQEKPQPGQELLFAYRLYWGAQAPFGPSLARVAATRTGIGGTVGRPRAYPSWRFVVDFSGGALPMIGAKTEVEAVITLSRGELENVSTRPLPSLHGYRVTFDVKAIGEKPQPVDLRLYLRLGTQALSETWLYQWSPPAAPEPV